MRRPEPYSSAITAASRASTQGSRVFARAHVGVGHRLALSTVSGFGKVLPTFGARIAASAPSLPLPSRFEEFAERAQARQRPHQRAAGDVVGAAHGHEGADVRGLEFRELLQRDASAPVLAQENQALPQVALVGFQRLRRQPPFAAQMRQPAADFRREIGRDADEFGFG